MGRVAAARRLLRVLVIWSAVLVLSTSAHGFEAFDGRLQAHGFFETQLRVLSEDFNDQFDLAQWYNVLNVEIELDIIQDSIGPLDLLSAYVRLEGRFDCVLYRGCGMMRSVNTYGDRSKDLPPRRLSNAEDWVSAGDLFIRNDGRLSGDNTDPVGFDKVDGFAALTETLGQTNILPASLNPITGLPPGYSVEECVPSAGDPSCYEGVKPFEYVQQRDLDFRFTQMQDGKGGQNGGFPIAIMGPWLPKNEIAQTNGRFPNKINPFDPSSITPVLLNEEVGATEATGSTGVPGNGARRFRPIPIFPAENPNAGFDLVNNPLDAFHFRRAALGLGQAPLRNREDLGDASWQATAQSNTEARGLYVPSPGLRDLLDSGRLNSFPFDFSNLERAFNRGASQQDEGELKEAYFDIETFDSKLWLRIGKQNIVWGKTELFRTTDQFNPTDLALASLPSLEEARIALWAIRGVYSFYEVGPLSDVRLELAMNFDEFEPVDLGTCGEAFAINLVCSLTLGGYAHGFTGFGIAGIDRPPNPWDDGAGVEFGGRIEFRWDRYSFQISDFYGYDDFPYIERITNYERNVDPVSARGRVVYDPQTGKGRGSCRGDIEARRAGLTSGPTVMWFADDPLNDPNDADHNEYLADPLVSAHRRTGLMDPDCLRPGPTDRELLGGLEAALFAVTSANDIYLANLSDPRFPVSKFGSSTYDRSDPNYDPKMDLSCKRVGLSGPVPAHCFNAFRGETPPIPGTPTTNEFIENPTADGGTAPKFRYYKENALDQSPENLTLFSWLCSNTIGFLSTDRTSCAQTIFGSTKEVTGGFAVGRIIGRLLSGDSTLNLLLTVPTPGEEAFLPLPLPIVRLSIDGTVPFEEECLGNPTPGCVAYPPSESADEYTQRVRRSRIDYRTLECLDPSGVTCGDTFELSRHLTSYQESLLGCGPFWGTNCDASGIDLLKADASALYQSFLGSTGSRDALQNFENRQAASGLAKYFEVDGYRSDGYARQIYDAQTEWVNENPGSTMDDAPKLGRLLQPGTLSWQLAFPQRQQDLSRFNTGFYADGGPDFSFSDPVCGTGDIGGDTEYYVDGRPNPNIDRYVGVQQLPGCRRKWNDLARTIPNPLWDIYEDGDPDELGVQIGETARDGANLTLHFPQMAYDPVNGYATPGARPRTDHPDEDNGLVGWTDSTIGVFVSQVGRLPYQPPDPSDPNDDGRVCTPQRTPDGQDWLQDAYCGDRKVYAAGNHPFTNEPFASEVSGLSWNFHMITVAFSDNFTDPLDVIGDLADPGYLTNCDFPGQPNCTEPPEPVMCSTDQPCAEDLRRKAVYNFAYSGIDIDELDVPGTICATPPCYSMADRVVNPVLQYIPGQDASLSKRSIEYGDEMEEFIENLEAAGLVTLEDDDLTFGKKHCSFVTTQECQLAQDLFAIAGIKRNELRAGGNNRYGRRSFWWQSGGEVVVNYDRRNVLGFSVDFAEDRSKTNWGVEFTWIGDVPNSDNNSPTGISRTDDFNLTVSMDRPTFINFLNPNRTFFFNSQWFFQYKNGYNQGFTSNGPFNVLATFTVFTGYFQDRLNPSLTVVGDLRSGSGALLPSIGYRFSENFSATVGINMFWGREQLVPMPFNEIAPAANRAGPNAYKNGVSNLLSLIRDRDEIYARIRYTF